MRSNTPVDKFNDLPVTDRSNADTVDAPLNGGYTK
jgi:hypothetical protein